MKEQMTVIAEVLESERQEWGCSFHMIKHIGEQSYDIRIEKKRNHLELKAKLPVIVDSDYWSVWVNKVRNANADVECGSFFLNADEKAVYYRVYSLYTHEDEVKDADAIKALLNCCYKALETQGEAILAKKKKRSLIDWFWDLLQINDSSDSEVCE